MNKTNTSTADSLTADDNDMLEQVLMRVRGSYPDAPYLQADYVVDIEPDA